MIPFHFILSFLLSFRNMKVVFHFLNFNFLDLHQIRFSVLHICQNNRLTKKSEILPFHVRIATSMLFISYCMYFAVSLSYNSLHIDESFFLIFLPRKLN